MPDDGDIPWYSDASLVKPGHIFCVGLLTNCLRKWNTLSTTDRAQALLKLSKPIEGKRHLETEQIEALLHKLNGIQK